MRVTLIPAAGSSSRMRGGDKLLEQVDGAPILKVLAQRALDVCDIVLCTLPAPKHPRALVLDDLAVSQIYVPDTREGMSVSLKAGVKAVPERATGLMILPADMPEITSEDMKNAWAHFEKVQPKALQCTTASGEHGHPILFSPQMFSAFSTLSGDRGAFKLLNALGDDLTLFALDGNRARLDLDTPEEWAEWRASRAER